MAESTSIYTPRNRPPASGRFLPLDLPEFLMGYKNSAEESVAQPFVGVTADGTPERGLFAIAPTGVSTAPIRDAAADYLAALTSEQLVTAQFPIDSDAWRRWSNIHVYVMRHGVMLEGMSDGQREMALNLMRASLSEEGYQTARDIMRLNETISEITGRTDEYGEWPYWLSVFGTPSHTEPWGWQIDGHHLIINCFVLGDQVVMTPMFMGSEPVLARIGKYKGTRVFETEEAQGLRIMQALTPEQQSRAIVGTDLPNDVLTSGFRDNFEMRYEGLPFSEMNSDQQNLLIETVETYIGRMPEGHARVRMEEVRAYLDRTYFGWIGGTEDDSVYYYRIHSPVLLIEFDHQRGIALDVNEHFRDHIHTIVRTPNGNDYGMDLLRQHYERYDHSNGGHTPR